jgi:hypothetical protein
MGFDLIHETLAGAPDIQDSPSLALSTAQASPDGDSASFNAQTASQAANYNAAVQAIQKTSHHSSHGHGWNILGDIADIVQNPLGGLKEVGSDIAGALSKPLQQVQHEYRYLKDVWESHGPLAFLLESGRLAAGAAVGVGVAALAPEAIPLYSAAVGGAGAATFLPHGGSNALAGYEDSWKRSEDGHSSFGRDIAHIIHFDPSISIAGHKAHLLSGTLDGVFDIGTDPVLAAGNVALAARRARLALTGPEDIVRAYNASPSVRRAVQDIAGESSPTAIMQRYPTVGPGLAKYLSKADTPADVFEVYKRHWTVRSYLDKYAPKLGFIRGNLAVPMKNRLQMLGID